MCKTYGAFGLVTVGCFFYSFLVRFILVSTKITYCDFFVMLAIEIDFAFIYFDGFHVYCALLLTKALYFCGFDVPG